MRFDVRKLTAALAVAGLAGAASPAMAQNTHIPSWVLTPYVSGFGVDGAYGVGGSDALKGIGGGISLGKTIADDFEVQLNVSHARRKDGANKVDQIIEQQVVAITAQCGQGTQTRINEASGGWGK